MLHPSTAKKKFNDIIEPPFSPHIKCKIVTKKKDFISSG